MNYSYSKENGGLKAYLIDNGRIVSGFEFSKEECEELYANLCEVLFDDLLEKNKDVLYRLKNNIAPPKMVSIDKACEWLKDNYPYYFEHTSIESELTFGEEFRKAMEE